MGKEHHRRAMRGDLLLIGLTILWGSSFVIIQKVERSISAGTLVCLRFWIAALILTPFLKRGARLWLTGAELGLWLWAGFYSQALGLRYTSPERSSFVTSLSVIFVPMLAVLTGRRIGVILWIAAAIALAGVALLCNDHTPIGRGDLWTLACAALFAVVIFRLETAAKHFPALTLTGVQLWTVFALSIPWLLHDVYHGLRPAAIPWSSVGYLAIICTALTTWLQTVGQRSVPAAQASIIYLLEPVFASMFAFLVLGTHLGGRGFTGSALILAATLLSQLPLLIQPKINPAT